MINHILMMVLLTVLPFSEARLSIPYGILVGGLPWWFVLGLVVVVNILVAPLGYFFWTTIIHFFRKIKFIDRLYHKTIERVQKKSKKFIDKYGELGLAIFIGIPIPGSGVYAGSLAATIFGLKFKKFMIAAIIGVVVASILITFAVVSGAHVFDLFVKVV